MTDIKDCFFMLQAGNIEVELGSHPRNDQVQLDWESFPARVDPGRGIQRSRSNCCVKAILFKIEL